MMRLALVVALSVAGCAQAPPAIDAPSAPVDTTDRPPRMGPVFAGPMQADPIFDAATLVEAMATRYPDGVRTLSFTLRTHRRQPDGTVSSERAREWIAIPGRLRVERGDPAAGHGELLVGDSTFVFRDGALTEALAERDPVVLWGFDVYAQGAAETLRIAEAEGTDTDAFRTDVWDGRQMYVLGTPETGEVWVEHNRLLLVRLVEAMPGGLRDVRLENYQRLGGGWIAPYLAVFVDGQLAAWQTHSEIVADPDLDPVLFDPRRWAEGAAATRE